MIPSHIATVPLVGTSAAEKRTMETTMNQIAAMSRAISAATPSFAMADTSGAQLAYGLCVRQQKGPGFRLGPFPAEYIRPSGEFLFLRLRLVCLCSFAGE